MSGTYTHGQIFYKPEQGASGATEKDTFDAALDNTAKIIAGAMPRGQLVNGAISVTILTGSDTLKVEIQTASGATPSATNPVWCRVGSRVVTITSALMMTKASGVLSGYATTSWLHLAYPCMSGYEVDLFTYIGWSDAESVPYIAVSREGWHTKFSFQGEASGHGAMTNLSTGPSTQLSTTMDEIAVCGRFAVTLTTPNTWSSPASGSFILQDPIQETRMLLYNPCWGLTYDAAGLYAYGGTLTDVSATESFKCHYRYAGPDLHVHIYSQLHYVAPSTKHNVLVFHTPISPQDFSVWGPQPFGASTFFTATTPTGFQRALITYPMATSVFAIRQADRASYSPGTMILGGRFIQYIPGQRRLINW